MSSSTNLWVLLGLGLAGVLLMTRRLKRAIKQDFGAFVERLELLPPPQPAPPKAPHPLTGLSFAVADIFDINGYVTGFGNPDWAKTHDPAARTSSVVSALVDGGATCVGKTVIDEMAYSINGENKHFGTPTNPAAVERIPGGCSSGSAVAVASGLVDFSLGVDTIGGVRIPGGFCGILAFRPSHAAVSNIGVIPVSPSLDTVGLFAKDPSILRRVSHILLQLPYADHRQPRHMIIADDCFELLKIPNSRATQVVIKSTEKLFGRQLLNHVNLGEYLASKISSLKQLQNGKKSGDSKTALLSLANAMRLLYKHEFKNNHERWINSVKPVLDPSILADMSSSLDDSDAHIEYCHYARNETRLALNALLKDDGILVLPTVLGAPPKLNAKEISSSDYQSRALCLSAIASMSGCCQATIPIGFHEKCPVSVSFIARHGGDRFLLDTVQTMFASLQEQVDEVMKSKSSSSSISKEESAEIAKEKGNIAYKEKQWQKAVNLYTEAIKLSEKNATYYSNRAAAYLELGSYLQAEADCSAAISLDKKNVKAYLRRGTAREMLGYYKEAIEDFKYALVLEPTNKTAILAASRLKKLFQ
ncbi:outer envelope protein 64, chloroplastic [Phoenix dactylifera]|uniref:Outer envelope protein 64, chloroplastic n=1 Tax=Phoenix dactylifera TaxID=42345 RepID=A0A8B7CZ76_PHODC|nr:outer envelope protein 64, chloroplastic [Phoenix dactylifera]